MGIKNGETELGWVLGRNNGETELELIRKK